MAYKVLIIGCGAIAGGYDADRPADCPPLSHAGAICNDDRLELVACVDPDDAVRCAFAERWCVPKDEPDLASLAAEPGDFDIVIISSPTACHAEHLEAALALKPHIVLCEKPLAEDLAEAERLATAYEDAGIPLVVNYTRRWVSPFEQLAKMRDEGEMFSTLVSAVGYYGKGVVHNGGHMVDLLHMLVGPLTLQSVGPARFDHWEEDPSVSAILTTEQGAPVHLVAGDARAFTQFELVLTFEDGEVAIRDGGNRFDLRRVVDSATHAGYRVLEPAKAQPDEKMKYAMQRVAANLANHLDAALSGASTDPLNTDLKSTAREALAAQRLCEEIRRKALENIVKDPE